MKLILEHLSPRAIERFSELPEATQLKILSLGASEIRTETKKKTIEISHENDTYAPVDSLLRLSGPYMNTVEILSPSEIKLDITSGRETLFTFMGCGSILFFIWSLTTESWLFTFIVLAFAIISFRLKSQTDDYLVMDLASRRILSHRKFKDNHQISTLVQLEDVLCLLIKSSKTESKDTVTWKYGTAAVTRTGDLIELNDIIKASFFECREFTRTLAEISSIPFYDKAEPETELFVNFDRHGTVMIDYA
jgi:hypothetical protein